MSEAVVQLDDKRFREALLDLLDLVGSLDPVMKDIAQRMLHGTRDRFRNEEDPDGRPWRRLNARYEKSKTRGGKILTMSGRMRRSITTRTGEDFAAVGTNAIYAGVHQKGAIITIPARSQTNAHSRKGGFISRRQASRRKKGVVRISFSRFKERRVVIWPRPFLGVSDAEAADIVEIAEEHLKDAWNP